MSVDEHFEGARFQLQAPVCSIGIYGYYLSAGRGCEGKMYHHRVYSVRLMAILRVHCFSLSPYSPCLPGFSTDVLFLSGRLDIAPPLTRSHL